MAESLDDVKRRLGERYLGKGGIHGVGLRRSRNAVTVYLSPGSVPGRDATLQALRAEAAPFDVIVVEELPPSIRLSSGC